MTAGYGLSGAPSGRETLCRLSQIPWLGGTAQWGVFANPAWRVSSMPSDTALSKRAVKHTIGY